LSGKYGPDFFKGTDKTIIRKEMLKVLNNGVGNAEAELVTKSGRQIPYYFSGIRKRLNGKDYLIGLGIDITKRRQTEEALTKSEQQFRQIVEQSVSIIEIYKPNGELIIVNNAWEKFWTGEIWLVLMIHPGTDLPMTSMRPVYIETSFCPEAVSPTTQFKPV